MAGSCPGRMRLRRTPGDVCATGRDENSQTGNQDAIRANEDAGEGRSDDSPGARNRRSHPALCRLDLDGAVTAAALLGLATFALLLALLQAAALSRCLRERAPEPRSCPSMSILKPLCGIDDALW